MNLRILSVQHRHHGLVEVERIVDSAEAIAASLRAVPGVAAVLPLATCNRVEFIVDARDGSSADLVEAVADELDLPPAWDHYDSDEALTHLFRVCAGLESMVVGEREIAGQVRRALAEVQDAGKSSPDLTMVVDEALRASRRVARETSLADAGRSVVSVALDLLEVPDFSQLRVLLVGTGAFAGASVAALRARGVHDIRVHSASGRGDSFARSHGLEVAEDLAGAVSDVHVVVTCRGTGVPAISEADVSPDAQLRILDLSLHSDVAATVAALPGVEVISLATLQAALAPQLRPDTTRAEEILSEGEAGLRAKLQSRVLDPAVVSLREAVLELVNDEVARLPDDRPLSHDDAARALRRLATRLLHVPSSRAKLAAASGRTDEYLSAMSELYGIGHPDKALDQTECPVTGFGVDALSEARPETRRPSRMTHSLSPYSAVLVASYGGPDKPEDVLPFMRNATAGRGVPDERLLEVSEHYMLFGGRSPINERNAELLDALRAELAARNIDAPVVIGNRNWHPHHSETVPALVADGHERVLGLATSAYHSYSSCRQYAEDLEQAAAGVDGAIQIDKIGAFAETDGFVDANADAVVAALAELRTIEYHGDTRVLFVTHSIPTAMNDASGDGSPGATYDQQHMRVAERIAARVKELTGDDITWELTYCSRSGSPHTPWLEPDVNDRLELLRTEAVGGVVASPIGFVTDHMEVVYDLDTEAAATAAELDLAFVRAASVGTHPAFIGMLVDQLEARAAVARGEADPATTAAYLDSKPCCHARPVQEKESA